MAFGAMDYRDFVDLLTQHPEWRPELRGLVLSDELLSLPEEIHALSRAQDRTDIHLGRLSEHVEALAEAQRHTESRLEQLAAAQERTEVRLEQLAAAQERTEVRLEQLATRVGNLAAAQERTDARLEELATQVGNMSVAQERTEVRLDRLTEQVQKLTAALLHFTKRVERLGDRVGELDGQVLEWKYRDKPLAYFSSILRRPRSVPLEELEEVLEERLTREEFSDIVLVDLLVRGVPRAMPSAPEVWLAIEVSVTVDKEDVARSLRRAALLRKAGYTVVPVVAGKKTTEGAQSAATRENVAMLQNGTCLLWPEALEKWFS